VVTNVSFRGAAQTSVSVNLHVPAAPPPNWWRRLRIMFVTVLAVGAFVGLVLVVRTVEIREGSLEPSHAATGTAIGSAAERPVDVAPMTVEVDPPTPGPRSRGPATSQNQIATPLPDCPAAWDHTQCWISQH
jgi:hypothetical protein